MKTKKLRDILFIVVIVGLIVGAYFVFVKKKDAPPEVVTVERQEVISPEAENVVRILSELNDLTVDRGLFESNAFKTLLDHHLTITPEKKGRKDPFAPFGAK